MGQVFKSSLRIMKNSEQEGGGRGGYEGNTNVKLTLVLVGKS